MTSLKVHFHITTDHNTMNYITFYAMRICFRIAKRDNFQLGVNRQTFIEETYHGE